MLKELLKPTLKSQPIIIRTDDEKSNNQTVLNVSGKYYPLIRVLNTVINSTDIKRFELNCASQFLPKLTVIIDDSDYRLRESLKADFDILTLYVGTNSDEFFIKGDYLITSVSSNLNSRYFTVESIYYVPKLYESLIRGFKEMSSLNVIKSICEETGLGLLSSIDDSDDTQNWLQDSKTNLQMIERCINHMYVSDNTTQHAFVDFYGYLNVVDLDTEYDNETVDEIDIHPYTGESLEEPMKISFTNNAQSTSPLKISYWTTDNEFGLKTLDLPSKWNMIGIDFDKIESQPKIEIENKNIQSLSNLNIHMHISDNVHKNYTKSSLIRKDLLRSYSQGNKIVAECNILYMFIYPYQNIDLQLYSTSKRSIHDEQEDENIKLDEISESATLGNENAQQILIEQLSGNHKIIELTFIYNRNNVMKQHIVCHKIPNIEV